MNRPHLLLIATSVALAFVAPPASAALDAANPFAKPSSLPLQYPAFDQIRDEHFLPAYEAGLRERLQEVVRIANNPQPATFENTIVAMEGAGRLLERVDATFSNLKGANTNDKLDAVDRAMAPKMAAHKDAVFLNPKLYARVKALYGKRASLGLDGESLFLLERYHKDFMRAGATLSAAGKARLKRLNGQIATLQTTFGQNVLKEANASALVVDTRAELDGMSEAAINAAAAEAKHRGLDGKFVLALMNTTGQPPLSVLKNRAVRERLMAASLARGSRASAFDNRAVVARLVRQRAERAVLLGYPNHAAYALEDQTAKDTGAVNQLLAQLAPAAVGNARREAADIQSLIDAGQGGFKVAAHDWQFYADQVSKAKYDFDAKELKPYFELNSVLENGVFFAATKLYGITFKERRDLPVYHPDVRVFDVIDTDGKQLAILLTDMYARSNKQGGAWMNQYVSQSGLLGTSAVIGNHLNIPKPPAGEPTLLTADEVRTAFHEFGHALHGFFSNVKYPRFSGTTVPRDFVEYPSQVNEMWMLEPSVLANYAKHYKTGEPLPPALLAKMQAAKKFNQGHSTTENVAAALLDQRWHQLSPSAVPSDVIGFEAAALREAGLDFAPVPPRYRSTYFSHIFKGGYAAGYYSYLWSEKLDADSVEWFKENGGLQRKNGDHFRKTLLSRGGTADAMQLFQDFRGREPKIEPLLKRRGLMAE